VLAEWQPARTLSPEAAAELDRLIEKAKRLPPETPTWPPMQEVTAEEFLRLRRARKP